MPSLLEKLTRFAQIVTEGRPWQLDNQVALWLLAFVPLLWLLGSWIRGLKLVRRALAIVFRSLSVACLVLGLARLGVSSEVVVPGGVVYLLDASSSVSAFQRRWAVEEIERFDRSLPKGTPRGVVAFGKQSWVVRPVSNEPLPSEVELLKEAQALAPEGAGSQTDLEGGILGALAALPPDGSHKIFLLSDGWQTRGDARRAARMSAARRIPILTRAPSASAVDDVSVRKIDVPDEVRVGEPFAIKVVLENRSDKTFQGDLLVTAQGQLIWNKSVTLPPGFERFSITHRASQPGKLPVTVGARFNGDRSPANDRLAHAVMVKGPPKILYVARESQAAPLITQILSRHQIPVEGRLTENLPTKVSEFLDYEAVILPADLRSRLTQPQADALTAYVEKFGGGLVVIGRAAEGVGLSLGKSLIDPLLPVDFRMGKPRPHEEKRKVSVLLLLDRSGSMSRGQLFAAKSAAIELMKSLEPEDMMGLTAFDTEPFPVLPLGTAASQVPVAIERLVTLRAGGGTAFLPALQEAANQLAQTGATTQHIILMSDGNTADAHHPAYRWLFAQLQQWKISISTIAIGEINVNIPLMRWIAQSTGGRFYYLENNDELPRLVVADTQRAVEQSPFEERVFRPKKVGDSPLLAGIDADRIPALRGYLASAIKPGAQQSLVATAEKEGDTEDPILAHWQKGMGRVAAFTSDDEARWSSQWVSWDHYEKFWMQVIRWASRQKKEDFQVMARLEKLQGEPSLIVEAAGQDKVDLVEARLVPEDGQGMERLSLLPTGDKRWMARLDRPLVPGLYHLSLTRMLGTEQAVAHEQWLRLSPQFLALGQEVEGQIPNVDLLTEVASLSSGRYNPSPEEIKTAGLAQKKFEDFLNVWVLLAIVFLLLDIAVRGDTLA